MDSTNNNLRGMRTYLVGAMDRVPDGGTRWRTTITPILECMGVSVLNPCKHSIHGIYEDEQTREHISFLKKNNLYTELKETYSKIRNADLRCVDICDFIIAHIDISIHACGSYEEIVTANRQKKPVLIWCEQGKSNAPNWLFFMLPHNNIFSSMGELIQHLQVIDKMENVENLKRWVFFKDFI
jgi:hypothetical protein